MTAWLIGVLPQHLRELQSDASPAAILLRLLPPLRCELQSADVPATILFRLLLVTVIRVSSPSHLPKQIVISYHKRNPYLEPDPNPDPDPDADSDPDPDPDPDHEPTSRSR